MITNWRTYSVHDEKNIKGFFGPFRFLSNYQICKRGVLFDGITYTSSESAYQAQKVIRTFRQKFALMRPNEARTTWKTYPTIYSAKEWDSIKFQIMRGILVCKFSQNPDLQEKLVNTGSRYLEETNDWRDGYWGVDIFLGGQNNLGKILMEIRSKSSKNRCNHTM